MVSTTQQSPTCVVVGLVLSYLRVCIEMATVNDLLSKTVKLNLKKYLAY